MLETKSEIEKIREQVQKYRITVNIYLDDKAYKCYNNQLDELRYWRKFLECFRSILMAKGKLFVISGPSGAGKGTICKEILDRGA